MCCGFSRRMPNISFERAQVVEVERCRWANKFEGSSTLKRPPPHVVLLLCDSQGTSMLLVVLPTTRWEVGSLFIKLHRPSTWPLGMLQIGSWLFTLAGLISFMRGLNEYWCWLLLTNCKVPRLGWGFSHLQTASLAHTGPAHTKLAGRFSSSLCHSLFYFIFQTSPYKHRYI